MVQTWNPTQAGSQLVFSNGNLTVTMSGVVANEITFGTEGFSTGRFYWETTITSTAIGSTGVGVGNTSSRAISGDYLGEFTDTLGWFGNGQIFSNATNIANWAAYTSPARVCIALDLISDKIWGRVGTGGNWNNDVIGNQNPAVGSQVGGLVLNAAVYATPAAPGINLGTASPADVGTGVFDSASWTGTPPTGFSGFDAPVVLVQAWRAKPISRFR